MHPALQRLGQLNVSRSKAKGPAPNKPLLVLAILVLAILDLAILDLAEDGLGPRFVFIAPVGSSLPVRPVIPESV